MRKVTYMLDRGCDLLNTFGGKLARILFYLLLCVIQVNDVSGILFFYLLKFFNQFSH